MLRATGDRRDFPFAAIVVQVPVIGTTLGVVWEFYEWFVETFTETRIAVGYGDTIADLAMDLLGSVVADAASLPARATGKGRRLGKLTARYIGRRCGYTHAPSTKREVGQS